MGETELVSATRDTVLPTPLAVLTGATGSIKVWATTDGRQVLAVSAWSRPLIASRHDAPAHGT